MADPILVIPRVVIRYVDPTTANNRDQGFVDGNIWINKVSSATFICTDAIEGLWISLLASGSAVGGGNLSFGDGVNSTINFDLGDEGIFQVNSSNIDITSSGNLYLKGGQIDFYYDRTGDPGSDEFAIVKVERGTDPDAIIQWNEETTAWMTGVTDKMYPIATVVATSRNPEDTDYEGHFVGQTWVNLVTEQKFTCMSKDTETETAKWRLALVSAPIKYSMEADDYLILFGADDDTFMKISIDNFSNWMIDAVGGLGLTTAGYGWVLDASSNIVPSEESITDGLFEEDGNGDLQPITTSEADTYFVLDTNDDIMPATISE